MALFRRMRSGDRSTEESRELTRREAWHAVAQALNGHCVEGSRPGQDKAIFQHLAWTIVLETYTVNTGQSSVTYTRARAPYAAKDDLKLTVSRRNFFSRFGMVLGMRTVRIGSQRLDDKYVIRSNNEARARALFNDGDVRALILMQPSLRLEVQRPSWARRRKLTEGARDVMVRTTGVIKDPARLENYVRLVAQVLEQLVRIGSAAEDAVKSK